MMNTESDGPTTWGQRVVFVLFFGLLFTAMWMFDSRILDKSDIVVALLMWGVGWLWKTNSLVVVARRELSRRWIEITRRNPPYTPRQDTDPWPLKCRRDIYDGLALRREAIEQYDRISKNVFSDGYFLTQAFDQYADYVKKHICRETNESDDREIPPEVRQEYRDRLSLLERTVSRR